MSNLFGRKLLKERKKMRLTAEMLAKACGTSSSYVTLLENGKRMPGKKVLPRIALALDLKTAFVLNWYLEDLREKMQQ